MHRTRENGGVFKTFHTEKGKERFQPRSLKLFSNIPSRRVTLASLF